MSRRPRSTRSYVAELLLVGVVIEAIYALP
jgi:hypothetical protein